MPPIPSLPLNNGRTMPIVGLGTWASPDSGDRAKLKQAVKDAIAAGYRHIDTAWCYEVEEQVGEAVREAIAEGTVSRDELFITTKLWSFFMKRDQVVNALKESLQKLGLDYVDLYLVHWPVAIVRTNNAGMYGSMFPVLDDGSIGVDDSVDIATDTWPGMEECVKLGLAKSIGISNFNSQQIEKVLASAQIPPAVNQIESHPFLTNRKLIDFCHQRKIAITAYSPFGGAPHPAHHSKVRAGLFDSELVKNLAAKYGKQPSQILIKFHVQRGVSTIPKSVNKARMVDNMSVFDFELTAEELAALEQMDCGERHCSVPFMRHAKSYPFAIDF